MLDFQVESSVMIVKIKNNFSLDDVYQIIDEVELKAVTGVLLSVKGIPLLDSAALGLLSTLYRGLKENQCQLGITELNHKNRFVLKISGLDQKVFCFEHFPKDIHNWEVEVPATS